jgi:hypothetical protein
MRLECVERAIRQEPEADRSPLCTPEIRNVEAISPLPIRLSGLDLN